MARWFLTPANNMAYSRGFHTAQRRRESPAGPGKSGGSPSVEKKRGDLRGLT